MSHLLFMKLLKTFLDIVGNNDVCIDELTSQFTGIYESQSKITEPYLITFESSKMDRYLDDISL